MSNPSRLRRWLRRLALVLGSLFVTALLLEGAIRLYSAFAYPRLMTVDDTLGWRHHANRAKPFKNEDGETHLFSLDAFGHRKAPESAGEAVPEHRVLVLGDSFTEAVHVSDDEVFTSRLAAADPSLEVINAGVGAWGTVQEYIYLRDFGAAFEPDLILLVVFQNDLADNYTPHSPGIGARPWARVVDDRVELIEDYDEVEYLKYVAPVPFRSFLVRNSFLFYAFNERVWQRVKAAELRKIEDQYRLAIDYQKARRVFADIVSRMHQLSQDRGAAFAVALIPEKETIPAGVSDWHAEVLELAKQRGFECISLTPAFAAAKGQRCYFDEDIHWTKIGHQVAAQALLPMMQKALAARK